MNREKVPQHVAIIMDGNGRWAKKRFLPRIAGHKAGAESVRCIVKACVKKNIKVLSLFAFSSENWRRPVSEINFLMDLFLSVLKIEVEKLHEQNICLRVIGERSRLEKKLQDQIKAAETLTAKNTGLNLLIATNYGGQWDLLESFRRIALNVEKGLMKSSDISFQDVHNHLSFADLPDPDLFIRTSGEQRISNFMLWQLAYTELYFTNTFWPDFDEQEFDKALEFYAKRERRFGEISEQIGTC